MEGYPEGAGRQRTASYWSLNTWHRNGRMACMIMYKFTVELLLALRLCSPYSSDIFLYLECLKLASGQTQNTQT